MLFTNQQMQATVEGLPRLAATNADFGRPSTSKLTEVPPFEPPILREPLLRGAGPPKNGLSPPWGPL
ncbi:hypothetical protein KCA24_32415, partial [Escherichia coli]|nr:hypothetical protein [Escherichia coli]